MIVLIASTVILDIVSSQPMSEIYMIRHGQASFGSRNYDVLSPLGTTQAEILAEHLIATGLRFDAVYAGTLERQAATGRALAAACRQRRLPPAELKKKSGFRRV